MAKCGGRGRKAVQSSEFPLDYSYILQVLQVHRITTILKKQYSMAKNLLRRRRISKFGDLGKDNISKIVPNSSSEISEPDSRTNTNAHESILRSTNSRNQFFSNLIFKLSRKKKIKNRKKTAPESENPPQEYHGEEEDDNSSISSIEESIMSAYSSTNESYRGTENLEKSFERRERTIQRLLDHQRRGTLFESMIRFNEERSKEITKEVKQRQENRESDSSSNGKDFVQVSSLVLIKNLLLFETYVTTRGFIALTADCFAHVTFHGLLTTILKMIATALSPSISIDKFYLIVMGTGLALMRVIGFIWKYLDRKSYDVAKFEMHNRMKLGYLDARFFAYLKGTRLASSLNIVGFYLCYIGASYFYDMWLEVYGNYLDHWWSQIESDLRAFLSEGESVSCQTIQKYREAMQHHNPWLLSCICSEDWVWSILEECLPHGLIFLLSILTISLLGGSFWEFE